MPFTDRFDTAAACPEQQANAEDLFITNPNPNIGRFAITREQYQALRRKYERDPNGADDFESFKNQAVPGGIGSDKYILLHWCGMWLGIELDGYTHS